MNFRESFKLAASSLNNNKLRSLLTLLGIIIGIMAVIIIMTLGAGLQKRVFSSIEEVGGTNHPVVVNQRTDDANSNDPYAGLAAPPPEEDRDKVSLEQLDRLKSFFGDQVTGVDLDGQSSTASASLRGNDTNTSVSVYPMLPDSLSMRNLNVEYGRGFSDTDFSQGRPVAVVSSAMVDSLFNSDPESALGERVDVTAGDSTAVFTIIGVLESQGNSGFEQGQMSFAGMYIPVGANERIGDDIKAVSGFTVAAAPGQDSGDFQAALQKYVDRWYAGNEDYKATVVDISGALQGLNRLFGIISAVLSSIGGISLLVGGIGVMNIMLITVTERTREIGVRKALGATQGDIRTQFIVEAILVCLVGGIIGIVLGSIIGMVGTAAFDSFAFPPIGAVVISLVFSLATGVFFGAYPASKAAKMQPIEALRYE